MLWIELALVLAAIFVGSRVGGTGMGKVAMLGVAILVFGFGLPPGSPPGTVLAIIVAVIAAAATLEAAGGMDVLVALASRALRLRPQWITLVAPLVAWLFTFCAGTGHVAYAILPVIAEVARKAGVRPERPMSISVIASQQAITASPLAAATVALLALLEPKGVTLGQILAVCIPSTLIGVVLGALVVFKRGRELAEDPVYLQRLARGLIEETAPAKAGTAKQRGAVGAVLVFVAAALAIVAFGLFPGLKPDVPAAAGADPAPLAMPVVIQIVMYCAAAIMLLACGAKAEAAARSGVAHAGVVAVISIVGLGWLGSCFFEGNREAVVGGLSGLVRAQPWVFALALFALSVLLFSQAATVAALMPVGIALGLEPAHMVAMFPAVNGYFLLPTYATIVAAASFDQTGTTTLGRYVLDHSFLLPGLVATVGAIGAGFALSAFVF